MGWECPDGSFIAEGCHMCGCWLITTCHASVRPCIPASPKIPTKLQLKTHQRRKSEEGGADRQWQPLLCQSYRLHFNPANPSVLPLICCILTDLPASSTSSLQNNKRRLNDALGRHLCPAVPPILHQAQQQ